MLYQPRTPSALSVKKPVMLPKTHISLEGDSFGRLTNKGVQHYSCVLTSSMFFSSPPLTHNLVDLPVPHGPSFTSWAAYSDGQQDRGGPTLIFYHFNVPTSCCTATPIPAIHLWRLRAPNEQSSIRTKIHHGQQVKKAACRLQMVSLVEFKLTKTGFALTKPLDSGQIGAPGLRQCFHQVATRHV